MKEEWESIIFRTHHFIEIQRKNVKIQYRGPHKLTHINSKSIESSEIQIQQYITIHKEQIIHQNTMQKATTTIALWKKAIKDPSKAK